MEKLVLPPISRFTGTLRPPGSKSIANRALPLAAVARGTTVLENLPDGEDVTLMRQALAKIGIPIASTSSGDVKVEGQGEGLKAPNGDVSLFLGNSGTATRILTALLCAGDGIFRIDGIPRMRERPIGDLVDALKPLSGNTRIEYGDKDGFPPLTIHARGLAGGLTRIRGDLSSQFTTGLILTLPLCRGDSEVGVEGKLVSAPYVDLTLKVMRDFNATVEREAFKRFRIQNPSGYQSPGTFVIEPDASSASYFLAAAAIAGGPITVSGIGRDSAQGEAGFARMLELMGAKVEYGSDRITVHGSGALRGIDADMDLMSDTGMTLAMTALFAQGKTTIRNVGNWRLKETDRLKAMATELRKVGAMVEEGPDWISIEPPQKLFPAEIDTYEDHRMAMCFSLVSLGGIPITIRDPGCVRKTYPGYFDDFRKLAGA
ncbi:MAG TPA: 3-phosphoshikimate 1-carboxyvinyltransferase [Fibrobacteres bacterium]|jgi:3-phosphoshikimate 1-carboxyvinyltransferase|nr:3-phosphoshikimate 1-carboxyvinyltransferase [Fibrobacterota bacterium]